MNKGKLALGLDIGSSSIKMVLLKESRRGYRLESFGMALLPPEAIVDGSMMDSSVVVQAIEELLGAQKIKQKDTASSVSGRSVIIKRIAMPKMSKQELADSIAWEAEQHIPFAIEDVHLDTEILPGSAGGDEQMDVLLVAAKKEVVSDYVMVLAEAGLKAAVMDVDAFAVQNAVEMAYDFDPSQTVALINAGASVTSINIVANGTTAFTRDVTVGGNLITEEIQKSLGISYEEAEALKIGGRAGHDQDAIVPQEVERVIAQVAGQLAGEVQRSLDFYSSQAPNALIDKVVLSGGTAKVPALQRIISERASAPVEVFDPFQAIEVDHKKFDPAYLEDIAPMAAVAVGLGLRRVGA